MTLSTSRQQFLAYETQAAENIQYGRKGGVFISHCVCVGFVLFAILLAVIVGVIAHFITSFKVSFSFSFLFIVHSTNNDSGLVPTYYLYSSTLAILFKTYHQKNEAYIAIAYSR